MDKKAREGTAFFGRAFLLLREFLTFFLSSSSSPSFITSFFASI